MKFLDEYRNVQAVHTVIGKIEQIITHPWHIMEVCGGQTHSMMRYGLDQLLPDAITLIHGPGCPVCVTPLEVIDRAIFLAGREDVILASYGDMLRVPGSAVCGNADDLPRDLFDAKSRGGDVRIVYSPLDAVTLARENPDKTVVFFAIGFETTAPANGMAVLQAAREGCDNFCILASHVTVPPAICAMMESPDCRINGFLAAGHVCTVMGIQEYHSLAERFQIPIVVTGFEPLDLVYGILKCVQQLESGHFFVENAYRRTAPDEGNVTAQAVIKKVFEVCDRNWRGIGHIAKSGFRLAKAYAHYDAEIRFADVMPPVVADSDNVCCSGAVLQGQLKPDACPAFGNPCTPLTPLGATMVSGEGACAAYYKYGRVAT